jgi:hypothetical protein
MAKMFFSSQNCRGATSGVTGKSYDTDKKGFIEVTDSRDIKAFQDGGYVMAGGMPRLERYWVCECGWEASINSCPKCKRTDLTLVDKSVNA